MIQIRPIDGDALLVNSFIKFGVEFPKRFPYILERFYESEVALMNPNENFFFKRGIFKGWLAIENNRIVGRIAAIVNPDIRFEKGKLGIVGLFECESDYGIAEQLLGEASRFLRSLGCTHVWGPMNFSIWHGHRFKTDYFEAKPLIGEPQNPPYYPDFFLRYGFRTIHEWESRYVDKEGMQKICNDFESHFDSAKRLGYSFERVSKKNISNLLDTARGLIMETYNGFIGFSEISKSDFTKLFEHLPRFIDKKATIFIKDPHGEYIGFFIVLKDLVDSIRSMHGKTGIWSKIMFRLNEGRSETANLYQGGLKFSALKEFKLRISSGDKTSLAKAFTFPVLNEILKTDRYQYAAFSLMAEGAPNRKYSEGVYMKSMRYHLYEIKL